MPTGSVIYWKQAGIALETNVTATPGSVVIYEVIEGHRNIGFSQWDQKMNVKRDSGAAVLLEILLLVAQKPWESWQFLRVN